jgi:hypothetical protein
MSKLSTFFIILAIAVALFAVIFSNSITFRYTTCFLAGLGYFDFLGSNFLVVLDKCLAEGSNHFRQETFKEGDGKRIKIHEFDCTQNFTWSLLKEESKDFTIPVICRGLLLDNKCRKWDLDYFTSKVTADELFTSQRMEPVDGNRRAFFRNSYPVETHTAIDTMAKMSLGEQLYVSFDNYFFTKKHPELVKEMDLEKYFPNTKFILNTLFLSNFSTKTLGSPFHAAPNDNFFFQCRGKKHWFYIPPEDLVYVGAYISKGVTWTSNYVNETDIASRINIYEGIVNEGDLMYNPPYWLHAVGTTTGLTISVANRVWQKIFPTDKNTKFIDTMYKINFPAFVSSIIWQRIFQKASTINSITLQENKLYATVTGGALEIID